MTSVACRTLRWDSEHFGIPIARLEGRLPEGVYDAEISGWCRRERIRCLTYLADAADVESIRNAERAGFWFGDIRVELDWRPKPHRAVARVEPEVRGAAPEDERSAESLARETASWSRFSREPGFAPGKAADMYACWVRQAWEGREARAFVVGERGSNLDGILTATVPAGGEGRIVLVAVGVNARGRGVGRALVEKAQEWYAEQGAARVLVATQGANVGAQRLYEACGFRAASTGVWLHKWFEPWGE